MTRKDLIAEIARVMSATGTPVSERQVLQVIDGLAAITTRELLADRVMHLPGIGGLQPITLNRTRSKTVKFHPWPALDDALNATH